MTPWVRSRIFLWIIFPSLAGAFTLEFDKLSLHRPRHHTLYERSIDNDTQEVENGTAAQDFNDDQGWISVEKRSVAALSASEMMRAMGTSPRRIFLSFVSASGIALAGNFLGVTSRLLTLLPEDQVEASGLDIYFPRGEFKRCRSKGYTFVIPKEWVADTFVELAKAQRQVQPLDLQMIRRRSDGGDVVLPDSAYGPPGRLNQKGVSESGDTNVSVIVTTGLRGFSLMGTLGSPETAASTLLRLTIAPEGSGRTATLLNAFEDNSRGVYQFEYVVDRGEKGPPLRNVSVIAASALGDKLYTLTVVAPAQKWNDDPTVASKLTRIATSFHLTQTL